MATDSRRSGGFCLLDVSGAAVYPANVSFKFALADAVQLVAGINAKCRLIYLWAILTPLVLWLGRRFLSEQPHLPRNVVIHFGLSFLVTALPLFLVGQLNYLVLKLFIKEYAAPVPAIALVVGLGATNIMVYWGIIGISQALAYFRRYKEREVSLAQAQLQAIQTQLHPHFLFNTLNAISELVHEDADRAEQTITQLSDLLRVSLQVRRQ